MKILGAGLAGCIAGVLNQSAEILESADGTSTHKALLRFRTPDIGEAVGIPFKKVKVYKGIWHNDQPVALSPRYIALYSRKVSDTISYRSICHQDTVERWVAPSNFHEMLRDQLGNRVSYNQKINVGNIIGKEKIISTLPMPVMANMIGADLDIDFSDCSSPINVSRYSVPGCDVYMTYYYTDPTVGPYRASIDGSTLIIESMWSISVNDLEVVKRSFGLTGVELAPIVENYRQHNGKIKKVDELKRREFIFNATIKQGIYSLGRFATWRNLVLDDVYRDILAIRQLINKDSYEHLKSM